MSKFMAQLFVALLALFQISYAVENIGIGKQWISVQVIGRNFLSDELLLELYGKITQIDPEDDIFDTEDLGSVLSDDVRTDQAFELAKFIGHHMQFAPADHVYNETCFVLNGKQYTKNDDSFYLKTSELEAQSRVADIHILNDKEVAVGSNNTAPIVIFYGCEKDLEFDEFNKNLYNEANFGKIRLVWRPTCVVGDRPKYASSATLSKKNWDKPMSFKINDIPGLQIENPATLKYLNPKELQHLDMKFTSMLLEKYDESTDFESFYLYFKTLVDNFPAVAPAVAAREDIDITKAEQLAKMYQDKKISHELLGFYVNGQQWKLTELDEYTLPVILAKEWHRTQELERQLRAFPGVNLQNFMRQFTLGYKYASFFDKNRYDLFRIAEFTNAVVFFNDFEKDNLYTELPVDNQAFLEPSEFNPIPSIKQNWNELIFVVDVADQKQFAEHGALSALIETLEQMKTGYPMRLGVIPFSSSGGSNNIIETIYSLKSKLTKNVDSVDSYIEYFKSLLQDQPKDGTNPGQNAASKDFIKKFAITDTSVIINGVLLPFEPKSWKIHTSRILSEDIEYLKSELTAFRGKSDLSIRQILHHRSLTVRHPVYLPNRAIDDTFTMVNTGYLKDLKNRVVYYSGKGSSVSIHTVTIVDDFNTKKAISILKALLRNNHNGVGIRLIHTGKLSKSWNLLESKFSWGNVPTDIKTKDKEPTISADLILKLSRWVPDIATSALSKPFVVLNGKFFNTDSDLTSKELWHNILIQHSPRSLEVLSTLYQLSSTEEVIEDPVIIEELTAAVIKYTKHSTMVFDNGLPYTTESSMPRVSLMELEKHAINSGVDESVVNITLLIDPVEERTQRFLYLAGLLKNLPFVKTEIALVPTTNLTMNPIHRFYDISAEFDTNDFVHEVDLPHNIGPDGRIIIEGHVFDENAEISVNTINGIPNVCISLHDKSGALISKGLSMTSFGYIQLSVSNLQKGLQVKSCDTNYKVVSVSTDVATNYVETVSVDITNSVPCHVFIKVRKVENEPIKYENDKIFAMVVVHDGQEPLAAAKMNAITRKVGREIKFYILAADEDALAELIPKEVQYEILQYSWPLWLRPQRFKVKSLEAESILLLDTLIPKDVEKLVFVSLYDDSAEKILSTDLSKYSESVLYLIPAETTEESYWKYGYWEKFLSSYKIPFYDLTSSYVVNMRRWREVDAGTTLRLHYHFFSKSFLSLKNIKADLMNSAQLKIPTSSLQINSPEVDSGIELEMDEL